MKLIRPSVEAYNQQPGINGIYQAIRDAAAICYQNDPDKMKLSPKEFVEEVLLKNGHTRPLEFGTVYLKYPLKNNHNQELTESRFVFDIDKYVNNHWSRVVCVDEYAYMTTNMRVIMQGDYTTDLEAWQNGYNKNWLRDVYDFWCEPTVFHEQRYTYTITASRGCTDDFRTHIALSSICESTRFCNYSKGKFGNEMTFIDPIWWHDNDVYFDIVNGFQQEEEIYMKTSEKAKEAQMLKRLVPLGIKAELRLCGFKDAWDNFLWRRLDGHADPECQYIAEKIKQLLW